MSAPGWVRGRQRPGPPSTLDQGFRVRRVIRAEPPPAPPHTTSTCDPEYHLVSNSPSHRPSSWLPVSVCLCSRSAQIITTGHNSPLAEQLTDYQQVSDKWLRGHRAYAGTPALMSCILVTSAKCAALETSSTCCLYSTIYYLALFSTS